MRDFVGSSSCFDLDLGGWDRTGGAASAGEAFGVLSDNLLGSPTSRLPCLLSNLRPGRAGLIGGVASSSSRSSGMTLDVSDAYVLVLGV